MREPPSPTSVSTNLSVPEWVPVAVAVQAEDLHNSLDVPGDFFATSLVQCAGLPPTRSCRESGKELGRPSGGVAALRRLRAPRAARRGSGRQELCVRAPLYPKVA